MDKSSLTSFVTVHESQSFTKAAEKLNITQPALSKRIQQLEQSLGCKLFNRIQKKPILTQSGSVFLNHAKQLLTAMENCQKDITNLKQNVSGELNLGVSHHIGLHRLPPYLKKFTQEYPQVKLNIKFVDSEQAYKMLDQGELEIALATLALNNNLELDEHIIWEDELVFVSALNSHIKSNNSLKELCELPAILPSKSTYTGQLIEQLFNSNQLNIKHNIETNYLETIKMMTSIGLGWAVLPKSMIDQQELKILTIKNNKNLHRKLGYITNPKCIFSNASKAFIETLDSA